VNAVCGVYTDLLEIKCDMIQEVPELTLLNEFLPGGDPMRRAIMFHYPTNTVAEILPADLKIAHYYGPKREFISKGPGGMTIGLMVFIHRTTAENLEPVFDKIEDCYYKVIEWMENSTGALADYLGER
jgi:hypothetical protein